MYKADFIDRLRCRLVELGCPMAQVRRLVREVADHRDDLRQAVLSEGLSGTEAEIRVTERMGDPIALAEHQMAMLRRSSWWGRHSVISFCLLPLLAVPLLWAMLLGIYVSLVFALGYGWDEQKLHAAADNPVVIHYQIMALNCADCIAISLVALLFCWLACRLAVSFKRMMFACVVCSLYGLFIWIRLKPHNVSVGLTESWPLQMNFKDELQVFKATLPLLIASLTGLRQWRTVRRMRAELAV